MLTFNNFSPLSHFSNSILKSQKYNHQSILFHHVFSPIAHRVQNYKRRVEELTIFSSMDEISKGMG